jgi:rubrerythrin
VKKIHHELFEKAIEEPEKFSARDYFLCYACRIYIAPGESPDKPVRGAVKKSFQKLI